MKFFETSSSFTEQTRARIEKPILRRVVNHILRHNAKDYKNKLNIFKFVTETNIVFNSI